MNYEIKNENILYEKILNANLFAGLFEQDFESSFEHPTFEGSPSVGRRRALTSSQGVALG